MLDNIWRHKEALEKTLGLPYVWIKDKEYVIDNVTGERADLVFLDMYDLYKGLPEATCYILELKKDRGDHELLGQIKKYMGAMESIISYGYWSTVVGMAVARKFTASGLKLLWKEGIRTFTYSEDADGNPILREERLQRKAVLTHSDLTVLS